MARTKKVETPLARIMREEGRKQVWLADRVSVDPATINRIIHGLHAPDATRQAIADALNRSVSDLFPEPGEQAA